MVAGLTGLIGVAYQPQRGDFFVLSSGDEGAPSPIEVYDNFINVYVRKGLPKETDEKSYEGLMKFKKIVLIASYKGKRVLCLPRSLFESFSAVSRLNIRVLLLGTGQYQVIHSSVCIVPDIKYPLCCKRLSPFRSELQSANHIAGAALANLCSTPAKQAEENRPHDTATTAEPEAKATSHR